MTVDLSYTGPTMSNDSLLTRAAGKRRALILIVTCMLKGQLATAIEHGLFR